MKRRERILAQAGIELWPKLFQNLRPTRATELAQDYPDYVVAAWLGHTPKVGAEHYRQVAEQHFRQPAQNAAQNLRARPCTQQHGEPDDLAGIGARACLQRLAADFN